jgi:hypothetical protein
VNARLVAFLLLALALILAPLGICAGGGMAAAAPAHAPGMHHASQPTSHHSGHGAPGKVHFCPDCQPPSFVKAGKTAPPDLAPPIQAVWPVALAAPFTPAMTKPAWTSGPSWRSPPLRRTYRIRRQI